MSPSVSDSRRGPGQPLIGITTRLDLAESTFYLRRYYAEAIAAAGGTPVYLPLIPEPAYLDRVGGLLDGLLLSGSNSDLDPARYGEDPRPRLGAVVPDRDEVDLGLIARCDARRAPILGICYGAQALNVARGGSLVQDIEAEVDGALKHDQGAPYDRPSHRLRLAADSLLARLAGGEAARVNSSHHQAIKEVGRDLRVTARAGDGVIEAVEDPRPDRFCLGVQWHPELGWERDALSRAIFESFVQAAGNFKSEIRDLAR